jgi:hypothetical protein
MEIKKTELGIQPQIAERLPWHKPEVQRLTVTLDTKSAVGAGSIGDIGPDFAQ